VAQTFSSGSTGADGALDLTAGDRTIQLPDSGILNYTTVNIPAGRTLKFGINSKNTPVTILAQGTVNIAGIIDVSAWGRTPGPGGFYGGAANQPGFGPSPGQPIVGQQNATWAGPLSLVPNIGGSGGGGINGCGGGGSDGGGGGGAITIASSSSIAVTGGINAQQGSRAFSCGFVPYWFAAGADGAIRLVANSISVPGCGSVGCSFLNASVVRLEAPTGNVTYGGCCGAAPVVSTINPTIIPSRPPSINIVSVGGYPVPSYSGSSFSTIDLLLPMQLQDPIPVVVQGTNVPIGSQVRVSFSGSLAATSTTGTLSGTTALSTVTVYISGLNRGSVTYLFANATFDATLISTNLSPNDRNAPAKIELAAALGQPTHYRFLRRDGSEVVTAKLPEDIRQFFGF
jgi:hypothetical protein